VTYPPLTNVDGLSPGKLDSAETMAESNLTLSHTNTRLHNGRIWNTLPTEVNSTNNSPKDVERGIVFTPSVDMSEMWVVSQQPTETNGTHLKIKTHSDGNTVHSWDPGWSNGSKDVTILDVNLTSGTEYRITVEGTDLNHGYHFTYDNFPVSQPNLDIRCGFSDGSESNSIFYSIRGIGIPDGNGIVRLSWDAPPDIESWDRVLYQWTDNGAGSPSVFVEDSNDNELAGPLERGGPLPSDPSRNLQFRVEMVGDTSLDSIYRRYIV
jgi:hypothetical protein